MDKEKFCQWLREQIAASTKRLEDYESQHDPKLATLIAEQVSRRQALEMVLREVEAETFDLECAWE